MKEPASLNIIAPHTTVGLTSVHSSRIFINEKVDIPFEQNIAFVNIKGTSLG